MKLNQFLNSELLPRCEKMPDVWSHDPYWALPDRLCIYSAGFNNAPYDKQSHLLVQDVQELTTEKYKELEKYLDCEVVRVKALPDGNKVIVHIHVEVD